MKVVNNAKWILYRLKCAKLRMRDSTRLDQVRRGRKIQCSANEAGRSVDLIETPRDKGFPKSRDRSMRGGEQSRARKDKWGRRILRCGRFPSGFPGNTRDVVSRPWEYEFARVGVTLYGLSVQDAIPNAVISGKAAAQRRATCYGNDTLGMEPSIIPLRVTR